MNKHWVKLRKMAAQALGDRLRHYSIRIHLSVEWQDITIKNVICFYTLMNYGFTIWIFYILMSRLKSMKVPDIDYF